MLTNTGSRTMSVEDNHISDSAKKPHTIDKIVVDAWNNIAPCWPLKNLVAANPLQGLEALDFEFALSQASFYFQQQALPSLMNEINRITIKWCQAFFDEGQATIKMPLREQGLYASWSVLAVFDESLHQNEPAKKNMLINLPANPSHAIEESIEALNIPQHEREEFLTLMLTSLPGWSSFVKYRTEWDYQKNIQTHPVSQLEYLAMRLIMTRLIWPEASDLLHWYKKNKQVSHSLPSQLVDLEKNEQQYRRDLLSKLSQQAFQSQEKKQSQADAQFIFCIDVRSEPFRRALEKQGNYETYGFAGFFGLSVSVCDQISKDMHASCPVLLTPQQKVSENISSHNQSRATIIRKKTLSDTLRRLYQSLKYNFTTPFTLAEMLGPWSGLMMITKTLFPNIFSKCKHVFSYQREKSLNLMPHIDQAADGSGISLADQCAYAESALRLIDLTKNISPLVVICGHKSETKNNAYAAALDCGACGGHPGGANAKILAAILNSHDVRAHLGKQGIQVPAETIFVAAEHNTTTDEVTLYSRHTTDASMMAKLETLQGSLALARQENTAYRSQAMDHCHAKSIMTRSQDWAQTRPEWGLARNAAFVVGPRRLTQDIDLEGRCFLHNYNWLEDKDGALLTTILTAPMVVAQWINTQYLFSTLDNVAFGSGSKVTQNITGKIGIMQGNGSDLMHGLPLQSVNQTDTDSYHQPLRLMTVVFAPRQMISDIIAKQAILQKLFGNGWASIACVDPGDKKSYYLSRHLVWQCSTSLGD